MAQKMASDQCLMILMLIMSAAAVNESSSQAQGNQAYAKNSHINRDKQEEIWKSQAPNHYRR